MNITTQNYYLARAGSLVTIHENIPSENSCEYYYTIQVTGKPAEIKKRTFEVGKDILSNDFLIKILKEALGNNATTGDTGGK